MRTVLISIGDAALRARMHSELPRDVRIEEVRSPGALATVARQVGASAVIVELPTDDAGAAALLAALQDLRRCAPETRRVVVCHLSHGVSAQATAVVRTDAGMLVLHPVDDVIAVARRALGLLSGDSVVRALRRRILPWLSADAVRLVEYAIRHEDRRRTVQEFAEAVGCGARTLQRDCASAGLPSPGRLLAWGRAMVVVELGSTSEPKLDQAAHACGFAGASDVRTRVKRLTGMALSEVVATGGLATIFIRRFGAASRRARPERPVRIEPVREERGRAEGNAAG